MISRERAERLWEALGRLKSLDREALDAFYIRGHSLLEIAEMLDVPLGTVKRRLHTARKRLKVELEASVADAQEWTDGRPTTPMRSSTSRSRIGRRRCLVMGGEWSTRSARWVAGGGESAFPSPATRPRHRHPSPPPATRRCSRSRRYSSASRRYAAPARPSSHNPTRLQHDRQQDDGDEYQADVGTSEDGEEVRNIMPTMRGHGGQRPGHAAVPDELVLDRLDAEPQPAELAPPVILAEAPCASRS